MIPMRNSFKTYSKARAGEGPFGGRIACDASRIIFHMKGLILAQNERWRRGLGMQVERERGLRFSSRAAKG